MPIYAYQCSSCGHAKDVLQKMSDPQLSVCPACGAPTFTKQVTAAGFQLKGSGWYVTDFRGGNANAAPAATPGQAAANAASGNDAPAAATATPAPSSSAAAPAAAPAASTASAASTSSETTK